MLVQALVAQATVERFHKAILLRLARCDVVPLDAGVLTTGEDGVIGEFGTIAGVPEHPAALRDHAMCGYVAPDSALRFTYRFCENGEERSYDLPARLICDDGEALVAAAVNGAGLGMANDYLMQPYLAEGRLIRVLSTFETSPIPISVVRLPTRTSSSASRLFIDMLRQRLGATCPGDRGERSRVMESSVAGA